MIKLSAHDKYNNQDIIIILGYEDEMHHTESFSNNGGVFHNQIIQFQSVKGDNDSCSPKRWSDLEDIKIIR